MEHPEANAAVERAKTPPSKRLRAWLIVVSIITALALVAGVPTTLFATYMSAFAADAPGTPSSAVVDMMVAVWTAAVVFYVILIVGISGAWIAYRKRRNRLSFGMSMLAMAPILLIVLAVAAVVVVNIVWTASIQGVRPSIP